MAEVLYTELSIAYILLNLISSYLLDSALNPTFPYIVNRMSRCFVSFVFTFLDFVSLPLSPISMDLSLECGYLNQKRLQSKRSMSFEKL